MSCHHKIELIDSWLSYHWRNQVPCLSSPHRPGAAGGRLAAPGWGLHLLCSASQNKRNISPRYHQMWARPPEMLVLGFQEDGWVPALPLLPLPPPSSNSHLMLPRTSLLILSGGCRLVDIFLFSWLKGVLMKVSKCKLASSLSWTRVMLFIKRVIVCGARASHQIYLRLVLISM